MVTQTAKEKNIYREALQTLQAGTRAQRSAAWVERLRESAIDRFEQMGFPTVDEEGWKYTNVAPIAKAKFETAFGRPEITGDIDRERLQSLLYKESGHYQLVFVNGIYRPDLSPYSGLDDTVPVVMSLADALQEDSNSDFARKYLARSADYDKNAFAALNTAFLAGGAFVYLPQNSPANIPPIHLLFLSDSSSVQTVSFPRVLIVCEEGTKATVIESYASLQEDAYLTNAVVEIVLKDNARLEHYKVQRESLNAFHVATTTAELGRSSHFNSTTITLGAQLSRHDISITFNQEGAECSVDGLYIVGSGQHADTHSLIDHREPHCTSQQLYKGILDGKSRAVFNGRVFVREGAQQTNAMQTNRNLLLSNEARVDTKPQLEIFADDVKCAHGATVGQLEDEELFYLASRGLHPDIARNLLTYGFAEEVIEKIKIESIRAQLDAAVLNRLHARLEA